VRQHLGLGGVPPTVKNWIADQIQSSARISQAIGTTLRPKQGMQEAAMEITGALKRIIAGALLSGGVAVAGLGLTAGIAQAQPGSVPPIHGPLSDGGPWTWCPGQPMSGIDTTTGRGGPGPGVQWDMGRCHTWWGVYWGHGNVAPSIWDGPDPPPPEAFQRPWCGFPFMCSGG